MSTTLGRAWEQEADRPRGYPLGAVLKLVLSTILTEVKGILNAKPLGCVSVDAADPGPVTLHVLHMGR